jgi:hypothetical protein
VALALRLALLVAALGGAGAQYCLPGASQASCTSVLVIVWSGNPQYGPNMQTLLRATGAFSTVDFFDATAGTPTSSQLATYDAVIVFGAEPLANATLLGDRLVAYHNQGGGVVVAGLANCGVSARVRGAWAEPANGYALLNYATSGKSNSADSLGDLLEPQSPLLTSVSSFAASPWGDRTIGTVINGGVVVAKWSGGTPFLVRGVRGGRTLVELTFYAAYVTGGWGWTGDGMLLIRNALKYSRCMLSSSCMPGYFTLTGKAQRRGTIVLGILMMYHPSNICLPTGATTCTACIAGTYSSSTGATTICRI